MDHMQKKKNDNKKENILPRAFISMLGASLDRRDQKLLSMLALKYIFLESCPGQRSVITQSLQFYFLPCQKLFKDIMHIYIHYIMPKGKGKKTKDKTLATKKYVKNLLKRDIEDKYYDMTRNGYFINRLNDFTVAGRALYFATTSAMADGVGISERVGDDIILKSVEIRMQININGATITESLNPIRIFAVQVHSYYDTSALSTSFSPATLFDTGATGALDATSPFQWEYFKKQEITVLMDKHITAVAPNLAAGGPMNEGAIRFYHFKIPMKRAQKRLTFQSGQDAIQKNFILFGTVGNAAYTTNNPAAYIHCRTIYEDA